MEKEMWVASKRKSIITVWRSVCWERQLDSLLDKSMVSKDCAFGLKHFLPWRYEILTACAGFFTLFGNIFSCCFLDVYFVLLKCVCVSSGPWSTPLLHLLLVGEKRQLFACISGRMRASMCLSCEARPSGQEGLMRTSGADLALTVCENSLIPSKAITTATVEATTATIGMSLADSWN